jgi:hypothetical protein
MKKIVRFLVLILIIILFVSSQVSLASNETMLFLPIIPSGNSLPNGALGTAVPQPTPVPLEN